MLSYKDFPVCRRQPWYDHLRHHGIVWAYYSLRTSQLKLYWFKTWNGAQFVCEAMPHRNTERPYRKQHVMSGETLIHYVFDGSFNNVLAVYRWNDSVLASCTCNVHTTSNLCICWLPYLYVSLLFLMLLWRKTLDIFQYTCNFTR